MEEIVKKILEKENINYKSLKKSTSGFTNVVYFADDVVIKLTNDEETKKQLKKECLVYKNVKLNNIPKYIASGSFKDVDYLIISKVNGKSLYSVWHTLTNEERERVIVQIAGILKSFHSQRGEFLDDRDKTFDMLKDIKTKLSRRIVDLKELGYNTSIIEKFIDGELCELFKENKYSLIYNDAHFDNFLYDNGKVNLIDFDRVRFASRDYEMLIFKTMCDNPSKFASEEDEDKIVDADYKNIYPIFKKEYPEMFDDVTEKRIKVYQFNYLIRQAIGIKNKEWIEELLQDFKTFFNCQLDLTK